VVWFCEDDFRDERSSFEAVDAESLNEVFVFFSEGECSFDAEGGYGFECFDIDVEIYGFVGEFHGQAAERAVDVYGFSWFL